MAMNSDGLSWSGIGMRFVLAIILCTSPGIRSACRSPTGRSCRSSRRRWRGGTARALKFLLGIAGHGWILYIQATHAPRRRRGSARGRDLRRCGVAAGQLESPLHAGPAIAHAVLVVLAIILAMGMSWSQRLAPDECQVDTDAVE